MSQVAITYVTQAKPSDEKNKTEYSFSGIKSGLYLDVQWEKNSKGQIIGIRSNYKLGAPEQIYRVPDAIFADDLGEYLLKPMFEELARMLEEAFAAIGESFTTTPSKVSSLKHSRYKLNGKTYYIPDFRDPEARAKIRDDVLTPFPDENGNVTLPCAIGKKMNPRK